MPQRLEKNYIIGIDVGGTNTDAVLLQDGKICHKVKMPTTPDIFSGVASAIRQLLMHPDCKAESVVRIVIGTTQLLNAVIQRLLNPVLTLRLGAPATTALMPGTEWSTDIKEQVINGQSYVIDGGYEYDGNEISPLNTKLVDELLQKADKEKIPAVAVIGVFSHLQPQQEIEVGGLASEHNLAVSLSHKLGGLGLCNRENATILNASLHAHWQSLKTALNRVKHELNLENTEFYVSNCSGTIQSIEPEKGEHSSPLLTLHSGPTNSIRGAGAVVDTPSTRALIIDIGGTTTDIGILDQGFPVMETIASEVAVGTQIHCDITRPRTFSAGLGGGSIIQLSDDGHLNLTDRSVENRLAEEALCYEGHVTTLTDIAVITQGINFAKLQSDDVKSKLKEIIKKKKPDLSDEEFNKEIAKIEDAIYNKLINLICRALSKQEEMPTNVLLIGGGSILFDQHILENRLSTLLKLKFSVSRPAHADVVNAVGAAIAQYGIIHKKIIDYSTCPRPESIKAILREAIESLQQKPIDIDTVQLSTGGFREVPLTYLEGDRNEVSLQLVTDLMQARHASPQRASEKKINKIIDRLMKSLGLSSGKRTKSNTSVNPAVGQKSNIDSAKHTIIDQTTLTQRHRTSKLPVDLMSPLSPERIDHIALGAGYLGSGGGGNPRLGQLIAKDLLSRDHQIHMIALDQLPDDAMIVVFGVMGSPTVLFERIPSIDEGARAIIAMENELGKPIDAIIAMEGGGTNATYPFLVAARLGLPVVDADTMGRAFPGIHMVTPFIFSKLETSKLCLAHHGAGVTILDAPIDELESQARSVTVKKGGIVSIAYMPMTGKLARSCCLPNTLSIAERIGSEMANTDKTIPQRIDHLRVNLQGSGYDKIHVIQKGRIIQTRRREVDGFSIGGFVVESCENHTPNANQSTKKIYVGFQNENLFAIEIDPANKQPKPIAFVPEIITVIDANTGMPISCEEYSFGQDVILLKLSVPAMLENSKALRVIGYQSYPMDQIIALLRIPFDFYHDTPKYVVKPELTQEIESGALLVSLGQDYYEGESLLAILRNLKREQDTNPTFNATIVVADTLQVHNALDPWQLGQLPSKPQDWKLEWVGNERDLAHEQPGLIRAIRSTHRIKYCGFFGNYSFIPIHGCADQLNLHRYKHPLTGETRQRGFSGNLPDCRHESQNDMIEIILRDVAQQTGKDWIERYRDELRHFNVITWDKYNPTQIDISRYQKLLLTDNEFLTRFLIKLANYRCAKNRYSDEEDRLFWTTIQKGAVNISQKNYYTAVIDKINASNNELSLTTRYILEETVILMDTWQDTYQIIYYNGEEPYFNYCRQLALEQQRSAPQWITYELKTSKINQFIDSHQEMTRLPEHFNMVELTLKKIDRSTDDHHDDEDNHTERSLNYNQLLTLLSSKKQLLLCGLPGVGKSTFCNHLKHLIDQGHHPAYDHCFILTADTHKKIHAANKSIHRFECYLKNAIDGIMIAPEDSSILTKSFVFIYDAFNELPDNLAHEANQLIHHLIQTNIPVIVTSTQRNNQYLSVPFTTQIDCQGITSVKQIDRIARSYPKHTKLLRGILPKYHHNMPYLLCRPRVLKMLADAPLYDHFAILSKLSPEQIANIQTISEDNWREKPSLFTKIAALSTSNLSYTQVMFTLAQSNVVKAVLKKNHLHSIIRQIDLSFEYTPNFIFEHHYNQCLDIAFQIRLNHSDASQTETVYLDKSGIANFKPLTSGRKSYAVFSSSQPITPQLILTNINEIPKSGARDTTVKFTVSIDTGTSLIPVNHTIELGWDRLCASLKPKPKLSAKKALQDQLKSETLSMLLKHAAELIIRSKNDLSSEEYAPLKNWLSPLLDAQSSKLHTIDYLYFKAIVIASAIKNHYSTGTDCRWTKIIRDIKMSTTGDSIALLIRLILTALDDRMALDFIKFYCFENDFSLFDQDLAFNETYQSIKLISDQCCIRPSSFSRDITEFLKKNIPRVSISSRKRARKYRHPMRTFSLNALSSLLGNNLLHEAAINGDLALFELLLDLGVRHDTLTKDYKQNLLHCACVGGNLDIMTTCLNMKDEHGQRLFDLESSDEIEFTPLLTSIRSNHIECSEHLLREGASPDATSINGRTCLLLAYSTGNEMLIKMLRSHLSPEQLNKQSFNAVECRSLLHYAVASKDLPQVKKVILENPQLVNQEDKYGLTPIMIASISNSSNAFIFLHEIHRADIHKRTIRENRHVFHLAARHGANDIILYLHTHQLVDIFEKDNQGNTALRLAVTGDHVETVKLLISYGFDPASDRKDHIDLRQHAIKCDSIHCLRYFDSLYDTDGNQCFNHDRRDSYMNNAVQIAAYRGSLTCLQYLQQQGYDLTIKNKDEQSLLHLAMLSNNSQLIDYLVGLTDHADQPYFDFNAKDCSGKSPLKYAVYKRKANSLATLAKHRANFLGIFFNKEFIDLCIEAEIEQSYLRYGKVNQYLIHLLIRFCSTDEINYFLDKVDYLYREAFPTNWENSEDKTPTDIAIEFDRPDALDILLKRNGYASLKYNVLSEAATCGSHRVISRLLEHVKNQKIAPFTASSRSKAIHAAFRKGHYKVIVILSLAGTPISLDYDSKLTLHHIKKFIEYGLVSPAHIYHSSNRNRAHTFLHLLTYYYPIHFMVHLFRMIDQIGPVEFDINATNSDGQTAVDLAILRDNCDKLTLLQQNGAELSYALHQAAKHGRNTIVRHLLSLKDHDGHWLIDLNQRREYYGMSYSALELAKQHRHYDTADLLRETFNKRRHSMTYSSTHQARLMRRRPFLDQRASSAASRLEPPSNWHPSG